MPYTVKKVKGGFKACKKKGGKCFSKTPMTKEKAVKQIGAIASSEKGVSKESFDTLINKYLADYIFSEDAMSPTVPANPNAPATPQEQARIKLAKQKKIQAIQKTQTKPATQAEADAYEMGRTEKI